MTTKKQDDLFPTAALVPVPQAPTTLTPSQQSRALISAERKIAQESHKQQLVIREQVKKTAEGQRGIGVLHESATHAFTETADRIWEARAPNGRDAEVQRYIDHYSAQTIQSAGSCIHAATIAGTERILDEVGRSLYQETKQQKGLLAILRGETS